MRDVSLQIEYSRNISARYASLPWVKPTATAVSLGSPAEVRMPCMVNSKPNTTGHLREIDAAVGAAGGSNGIVKPSRRSSVMILMVAFTMEVFMDVSIMGQVWVLMM